MSLEQSYIVVTKLYFILYLLCLSGILYYFTRPLWSKKWQGLIVAASYFFSMVLLEEIAIVMSNFTAYLIGSIMTLLVMLVVERGQIAAKYLYMLLFFAIRWLLPTIFTVLQTYTLNDWLLTKTSPVYLALVWTVKYALLFSCFYWICRYLNAYLTRMTLQLTSLLLLSIPAILSIISYYLITNLQETKKFSQLELPFAIFYLVLLLVLLYFIRLYVQQQQAQHTLTQQAVVLTQMNMTKQHFHHIETVYEELANLKHDLHNHFDVLEQLIVRQQMDAATQYMATIQQQALKLPTFHTGHPVTDAIIQQKITAAQEANIALHSQFSFPSTFQIEPFDISIVLNNLLDNAITATKQCEQKVIKLFCSKQHDLFFVYIQNPIATPLQLDNPDPFHGIGLANVRAVVEKYNGHLLFNEQSHCVIVTAVFARQSSHS